MNQLREIFVNDIPLIDVRAEIEFVKGSFPSACNFPILNDDERHQVGISYKQDGPTTAEALGNTLVSGDLRDARILQWSAFVKQYPETQLFCFRGGKRSEIACQWLRQLNIEIPRIPGGYKAMRGYLVATFESIPDLAVISGQTGVGKTELLQQLPLSVDLEGRANHRGSAFGRFIEPQPAQINFENQVAIDLLKLGARYPDHGPVMVEDESRLIGRINLPLPLQDAMKRSPVVLLEDTLEHRTDRIHKEYILVQWQDYRNHYGNTAAAEFDRYLNDAIDAIRKRLGGDAHKTLKDKLGSALKAQLAGDFMAHKYWIRALLEDYYDPMYNYQLEKKRERIVFKGNMQDIIDWTKNNSMCSGN